VRALLRSAEELRKAQQRALSGKGGAELRERLDEQRKAVRALARLGRDILASEGRSVSDAIVERIAKTLDAAALDEGSRFLLRAGRLTAELEPSGFDVLAGMTPAKRAGRGASTAARGGKRERVAGARRAVQAARQEARKQAQSAADAEREVERAESAAAAARRAAQEARDRSDAAEQALSEAEAALREAQRG
jgi:DNA repair protein SbcC/Rad50